MLRRVKLAGAITLSATGLALWVLAGHAIRRNLFALDRTVVFAPAFTVGVATVLGLAVLAVMSGLTHARRSADDRTLLPLAEVLFALLLYGTITFVVGSFRIVGDVGPRYPITPGENPPMVIAFIASCWQFHVLTVLAMVVTFLSFAKTIRRGRGPQGAG